MTQMNIPVLVVTEGSDLSLLVRYLVDVKYEFIRKFMAA
eukprot:COSAG02_NODE_614_length_19515_cov_6.651937_12_plen_39_part_00